MAAALYPTPLQAGFRLFRGQDLNALLANPVLSTQNAATAHAGGTRAAAFAISATLTNFTVVATAADSAVLPKALPGMVFYVTNNGAAAMTLYANGTDTINGTAGATGVSIVPGVFATLICSAAGTWLMDTSTAGAAATNSTVIWADGGAPAAATTGNDTACSNGDRYWVSIQIPRPTLLTGLSYLIGSVGGTDKAIAELHNNAGALVATSALAGVTVGTAANLQSLPFTATYTAQPGRYFAAMQFNGTTAKFRTYTIPGSPFITGTAAGTFGTSASITPGTTFTANVGPIVSTY